MMLHFARPSWPFQGSKIIQSGSFTLEQVEEHHRKSLDKNDMTAIKTPLLYAFGTERRFRNGAKALKNAIKNGSATIRQSGMTEGWGISTVSLQDAERLALATAAAYKKQQDADEANQRQVERKRLNTLGQLTAKQLNKPVYIFVKQDYSGLGLCDTFSGTLKLSHLVELGAAKLVDDGDTIEAAEKQIIKVLKADSDLEHNLFELFCEEPNVIAKLLKKGFVSTCGEVGYEAVSLKSVKHAKQLVAKAVLKWEMDGDC